MANTELSIVLKTKLEKSGIRTELQQIQKIVNKYHIELIPELKTDAINKQFQSLCTEMANDFNKTFGSNFTGNEISQIFDNIQIQSEDTTKPVQTVTSQTNKNGMTSAKPSVPAQSTNNLAGDGQWNLSSNAIVNQNNDNYTDDLTNGEPNPNVYESIAEQANSFTSANEALNEYNENLKQTDNNAQKLVDTMGSNNSSLDDAAKKYNDGTTNLKQYGASLVAAKIKTVALQAVTATLSSAVSSGVSFLISKAFTAIDDLIHREERLTEAAETGSENINDAKSSFDDMKQQTGSIAAEFAELSQGVNQTTGKRKSLSDEDYKRYLELSNQLAESLPNIGYTFDESGNKIVNLKGNTNDITNQIDDLIQAEQSKTNQTIDKNMDDVFKKAFEDLQTYSGDLDQLNSVMTDTESVMNTLLSGKSLSLALDNQSNIDFYEDLKELFQGVGLNLNAEFGQISLDHSGEWAELTDQEIAQLEEGASKISYTFSEKNEEVANSIQSTKENIQSTLNGLSPYLNSWVSTTLDYQSITGAYGNELGSAIQTSISSINWANIEGVHDWDDAEEWIQDNILTPLKDVDNQEVRDAYTGLFTTDLSNLPVEEAKKIVDGYVDILYDYLKKDGESKSDFKLRLGFDVDSVEKDYRKSINQSLKLDGANKDDLKKFFTDNSINTSEEINHWNEITKSCKTAEEAKKKYLETYVNTDTDTPTSSFSKAWENLDAGNDETKAAKQQLLELAEAGQLTEEAFEGSPIAKQFMKETGLSAEEATKKINKLVDSSKQLSSMKSGISAIISAYDEKKANNNYVSNQTLESMQNTLGIDDTWSKKDLKVWEEYQNAASDTSMSLKDFKKYQDALATSYVNSGNFLANLTSENQNYYDGLLTEMGVTNAHQITTKLLAESEKYLSEQKTFATANGKQLTDATAGEIQKFIELQGGADTASNALLKLALEKEACNDHVLDFSGDCSNLLGYVQALGGSTRALQALQAAQNHDWTTVKFLGYDPSDTSLISQLEGDVEKAVQKASNSQGKTNVTTSSGNKSSDEKKDSKDNNKTKTKTKESKQSFDWLERKVTVLNSSLDLLKAKIENAFSVNKKNTIIDQEIAKTNKLIKTYQKQVAIYNKKANSYAKKNLSTDLKNKVDNGKLKGKSYNQLVQEYGETKANKIQKYMDLKDKVATAKQNKVQAKTTKRELQIEKKQNYVDKYDALSGKYDAQIENATTAKAKNDLEDKKLKYTKKSYNYQIKIAKLERDSVKAATLKAEKDAAIRDIKIEEQENLQSEADAYRDMLDAQIENVTSAKDKNKLLQQEQAYITSSYNAQIAIAKLEGNTAKQKELEAEKQKELLENKNQQLQNLSDEQSAQYDLNQQLEDNATTAAEKNKYEANSRKNLQSQYSYEIQIAKNNGDVTEQKRLQAEYAAKIAESHQKEIENLKEEYSLTIGLLDAKKSTIDAQISALQANGYNVSADLYKKQQEIYLENYENTLNKIASITGKMADLDPDSQDYKNYLTELESYKQEAWGYQEAWGEAQQAINAINLSQIERLGTLLEHQASQLEYIQNILGHSDFTLSNKEIGGLTTEGLSSAAVTFQQMANNNEQIANKWEQYHEIERQVKSGERNDAEALEEMNTLEEEINELENANYDFGDSIKSMVIDSLNSLADSLDENITKYKDTLQAEKDLYDYRKKISKQLKSISALEKQLAALQGDQSEEVRARIQKLQLSLEEENDSLKEMEYEKYIQDQEEMLDSISEDFQDFIANVSDMSVSQICEAVGHAVTDHQEEISNALKNAFEESTAISNVASSVAGLDKTISSLDFGTKSSTTVDENGNTVHEYTDDQGNHNKITTDKLGNIISMSVNGKEIELPQNQVLDTEKDIENTSASQNYTWQKGGNNVTGNRYEIIPLSKSDITSSLLEEINIRVKEFQKLADNLFPLNTLLSTMNTLPNHPAPINKTMASSLEIGNVNVEAHLDGSHIEDVDSFIQKLHEPKVLKEISDGVSSQFGNLMSNQLSNF